MTLARARILKGGTAPTPPTEAPGSTDSAIARARILPAALVEARAEAARIVAEARATAAAEASKAAADAAREAREEETARLAAGFLALREAEARQLESGKGRLVELATLLAERLLGEALRVEPQRIAELAAVAIEEARGARRIRISASPEDVTPLREAFAAVDARIPIDVEVDSALERGSLVLHTDLGTLDARLAPQLERLAAALREALR